MGRLPTLSVLMPNYNHAHFIPESLGAILAQSYRPMEVIVLDDASTDNSVEVIESIARKEPLVRLVRNERNMGVERSVNRLLEMSSGEYIYSPSADDRILPGFFEKSMALLAQYPQAGLCSTIGRLIDENGNDRGIRALPVISNRPRFFSPDEVRRTLLRYGRWINAGSVVYRRDALVREIGQITGLGSFADTFTDLVIALRYGACYIPEPLQCWRQMATGYAARTARNVEALRELGERAISLMGTEYSDLFPAAYVDKFERHWMYVVNVNAWRQAELEHERVLRRALGPVCQESSFFDRACWFGMRLFRRAQTLAWQLYSMAKFAPWHWWILGRLSIVVNLKKVVIVERLDT